MNRKIVPRLLALIAVTAAGCTSSPWRSDRATEVVVGPYIVPIPAGWRNLSEARDQTLGWQGIADGYTVGAMRFHGDAQFLVLCTHDKTGDSDADAACATVFASLHIAKG